MNETNRTARVIAVTSGKGGVGKTNVAVNLGVALARAGQRTMLVDCDVGLANANILLGVDSDRTIADLAIGEAAAVVRAGPAGMMFVAGHSGVGMGAGPSVGVRVGLASALRPYAEEVDTMIVDTGGGMAGEALSLIAASDLVLVVLSPEPTAFVDAYAMVKALALRHGCVEFAIVANRVSGETEGRALFDRFERVIETFLPVHLDYLGAIPEDRHLRDAVYAKRPLVEAFPSAPASAAFGRLARRIAARGLHPRSGGEHFFGLEAVHGAH